MTLKFKITKAMKTMFNRSAALIIGLMFGFTNLSDAQIIVAGPDTSICIGSQVTLTATVLSGVATNVVNNNNAALNDDQWSAVVPLPFPFTFYGNVYNQCIIGSNNVVSFNTANAGAYCTWPISNIPAPGGMPGDIRNCVMGPWHDLLPPAGGTIKYGTVGTAPNRIFVVEWCTVAHYLCTGINSTDYILLYEGTNVIENHILNKPVCTTWNGGKAIRGLINATATLGNIVPGQNTPTQWTVANDARRWTPPSPYVLTTIPYGPPILANATITWTANGNPVGTGPTLTVSPTTTTNYIASVVSTCGNITYRDTATVTIVPAFTVT